MPAESAASSGASEQVSEPVSETSADPEVGSQKPEVGEETQPPERLTEILGLMSEDVPGDLRQEVEQSHEQKQQKSAAASSGASDGESESAGEGGPTTDQKSGTGAAEEPARKKTEGAGKKPGGGEEDDAELTADQKKQWPADALGRIHKVASKRDEYKGRAEKAERETTELKDRLSKTKPVQVMPSERDPLSHITDEQDLAQSEKDWEEMFAWAERNREGVEGVVMGKDKSGKEITQDYTAEQMANIRINAERMLRKAIPQRGAWIAQNREAERIAREQNPAMFEDGTNEKKVVDGLLEILPEMTRFPDYHIWLSYIVKGIKAENEEQAAAKNAGAKKNGQKKVDPKVEPFVRKHPPIAETLPNAPGGHRPDPKVSQSRELAAAEKAVDDTQGSEEAMEDFVAQLRENQRPEDANREALV